MKKKLTYLLVCGFSVASCGGGTGSKAGANNTVGVVNPPTVLSMVTDENGCVRTNNADARVTFLMGDKLSRYLVWTCATVGTDSQRLVHAFLTYDYDLQCYQVYEQHEEFSRCTQPAEIPRPAVFSVDLVSFDVAAGVNDQGLPGFSYTVTIGNSGNVPAYGVSYSVAVDGNIGGNRGSFPVVAPGQRHTSPATPAYGAPFAGKTFRLSLSLTNVYGDVIAEQTATVTAPAGP